MFRNDDLSLARRMHESGSAPSEILRHFALSPDFRSVPDLMYLLCDAFGVDFGDTTCIGGWWHDGTGELSDQQLDALLIPLLAKARPTQA